MRVVGGHTVGKFVQIGFAEENGAGFLQLDPNYGVVQGDQILKNFGASGRADIFRVDVVLQRNGNSVERAAVAVAFAAAGGEEFGFGLFGLGECEFGGDGDVGG